MIPKHNTTMKTQEETRPMTWSEIVKKHYGVSPVVEKKPKVRKDEIISSLGLDKNKHEDIIFELMKYPYKYLNCIYKSGEVIVPIPTEKGLNIDLIFSYDNGMIYFNIKEVLNFKNTFDSNHSLNNLFDESYPERIVSLEDLMLVRPFSPVLENIMNYLKCPKHFYDEFINVVNSLLEKYSHKPLTIKEWYDILSCPPKTETPVVIYKDSKSNIEVSYNVSLQNVFISFKKHDYEIKITTPLYFDFYVSPDEYNRWLSEMKTDEEVLDDFDMDEFDMEDFE